VSLIWKKGLKKLEIGLVANPISSMQVEDIGATT